MKPGDMVPIPMGGAAKVAEEAMRETAKVIRELLPPELGFTLFVFDQTGKPGHLSYISSADRDTMIGVIRKWLELRGNRA